MARKIDPALAGILAFVAGLFGCACLLVASLAGLGWKSWKDYQQASQPARLINIPGGEFSMGTAENEIVSFQNEKPQHSVYLDEFWIEETKVTNGMYEACVWAGKCTTPGTYISRMWSDYDKPPENYLNTPVTDVTWQQARDYCQWLDRDLPTEAQWEKARRAGVLDMGGSAWEWISDWYDASYYAVSPAANPTGPTSGHYKVLRGGSWLNKADYGRPAYRFSAQPEFGNAYIGFRCASSSGK